MKISSIFKLIKGLFKKALNHVPVAWLRCMVSHFDRRGLTIKNFTISWVLLSGLLVSFAGLGFAAYLKDKTTTSSDSQVKEGAETGLPGATDVQPEQKEGSGATGKSKKQKSSGATAPTGTSTSGSTAPAPSFNIYGNYSTVSIENIVSALELVFNDALNDYTEPGGGGPPGGVYPYPPIDLDNVYMGVRDGRLYIRWTLGGTIPTSQQTENGNKILSVVYNIRIDNDNDLNDNCGGAETHLQINIAYHDDGQIWYNPWFNANCLSGEGEHDATYERTGSGLAHTYNSGIGKNSIVWSYALGDLAGTVAVGNTLQLDISSEAEGSVYHHYSYDQNPNPWVLWNVKAI